MLREMRKILHPMLLALSCQFATAGFFDDFQAVQEKGKPEETRAFIENATDEQKKEADYHAAASSYWWNASEAAEVTTKPAEKGDFSIRDQDTGEEVGSLSFSSRNQESVAKAVKLLEEGTAKFPHRVDLLLGLAHIQSESGKHAECVATLERLLATAKAKPDELKWTGDKPLPEPAAEFIPEALQGYTANLFNEEQEELSGKLCDQVIAAYPEHGFAYNMKAAIADSQGNKEEMQRYLELALAKSPDDPLILLNLGDVYAEKGDKEKAGDAFKKVVAMETDEDLKDQAKEGLEKLGGK